MKVLVIDDTRKHLGTALTTLEGNEITLCSSHDEAIKLVEAKYDRDELDRLKKKYHDEGLSWNEATEKACKETRLPYWDAVLCDLLMPAARYMQGSDEGQRLVGQEMAVGWSLALSAARNGAKYVAVLTDTNHHNHPASAMLDGINDHVFDIDGVKMLMTNQIEMVETGAEITCSICKGSGEKDGKTCWWCKGKKKEPEEGKDWGKVLKKLTAVSS